MNNNHYGFVINWFHMASWKMLLINIHLRMGNKQWLIYINKFRMLCVSQIMIEFMASGANKVSNAMNQREVNAIRNKWTTKWMYFLAGEWSTFTPWPMQCIVCTDYFFVCFFFVAENDMSIKTTTTISAQKQMPIDNISCALLIFHLYLLLVPIAVIEARAYHTLPGASDSVELSVLNSNHRAIEWQRERERDRCGEWLILSHV